VGSEPKNRNGGLEGDKPPTRPDANTDTYGNYRTNTSPGFSDAVALLESDIAEAPKARPIRRRDGLKKAA
jgi:hypothetical protein